MELSHTLLQDGIELLPHTTGAGTYTRLQRTGRIQINAGDAIVHQLRHQLPACQTGIREREEEAVANLLRDIPGIGDREAIRTENSLHPLRPLGVCLRVLHEIDLAHRREAQHRGIPILCIGRAAAGDHV